MINSILITLDTDWAPDFILSDVAEILSNKNIKATWFVTNNSIFLDSLKKNKLFGYTMVLSLKQNKLIYLIIY